MPVLDDSLLGKMLDEYKVERALGKGGMARVYLALDTRLQRYVALKVIAPDLRADQEYSWRFEREAQSIARLEHPNIVHIYRFGEVDGLYYMAMQYIDGADLERIIVDYQRDGEAIALTDAARIIRDIGSALDYAHSRNVIHRDIKPGNILLDKTGRAILTDFGLALLRDVGTRGEIFGSPLYIAPEQAISSGNVVPQSDLYALGIVLYYMLTGSVPFKGDDPLEVALQHVSDAPPRPSQLNPALSAQIDAVVLRCLEKEPHARYQTGEEFSTALDAAISAGNAPQEPAIGVLRYSQLQLPAKVHDVRRDLPPLPEIDNTPTPIPAHQLATRLALPVEATRPGVGELPSTQTTASPTPNPVSETVFRRNPAILWVSLAVTLGGMLLITLCGLVITSLVNQGRGSPTVAAVVEATSPAPTGTLTATSTQTPVPTNTLVPTPTPLVLLNTPPQAALPTAPPFNAPPEDRSMAPPGSRRLGEFAVEWYCNERGLGVIITNNGVDWACTNRDGSTNFILQAADFDQICRSWYRNPNAFAIRDQRKETQAYNWSCYEYVASDASVLAFATPSVATLELNYGRDWVGFTNVSATPLTLADFELRRDERTLNAGAWGRSVLNPGECLLIHKSKEPPKNLPSGCTVPISLPGDKDDREFWLRGEVLVYISPNVQYRYQAK